MKKSPMPMGVAVGTLVVGILLGSVFVFGTQFWNARVERTACERIETQFLTYDDIRQPKRPMKIKEIAVDCMDGQRYFIDGVSVNTELTNALSELQPQEPICLLIHPNSNTIVEFTAGNHVLLDFDETIGKLEEESTGFLFLGLFMYFCALCGLYYIVLNGIEKRKSKKW